MTAAERTLIVGVDYSDFCIPAVDQALQISAGSPSTHLVAVLALPEATPTRLQEAEELTEAFVERAQENLVRLVQNRARALGAPLPRVSGRVCFGEAAKCLLAQARDLKADLLLVGTHSRRGLDHLLMGSVAEEVVREAPCSVLVARAKPLGAERGEEEFPRENPLEELSGEKADEGLELLSEPHLDAGRVVLHVLDVASGQTFVCSFRDFSAVAVEPLEGNWVPAPSAEARARAARFALVEAGHNAPLFTRLFAELTRRRRESRSDPAEDR
ncbi:MAG TPA: universal stress protein [Polyangiaceae bacterium]|nr:universal stress protein [Polyangiaceae bacterium]